MTTQEKAEIIAQQLAAHREAGDDCPAIIAFLEAELAKLRAA